MPIEANTLRIIIILIGILLALGIYIWERFHPDEEGTGEIGWQDARLRAIQGRANAEQGGKRRSIFDSEEQNSTDATAYEQFGFNAATAQSANTTEVQHQAADGYEDNESKNYWHNGLSNLILQLTISAKGSPFKGTDVLKVAERAGLKADTTGIFHYYEGGNIQEPRFFSMASMVKPGVFPLQALEGFLTPGLILFTQLPCHRDGLIVFTTMLTSARAIATGLGGELQDDTRSRLTNQTIEHIQAQIVEYQRQLRLANRRSQQRA